MLSERQKKIVELILKHPQGLHASTIANDVNVSSRTIRNDIASINISLMNNHCMINSSKRVGYFIVQQSVEKVKECLKLMEAIDHKQIANSPMERKYYILGQLLKHQSIDLFDASNMLFVSEQTVYKDMMSFQKTLQSKFHFSNITLENGCIQLHSDEEELRTLFYRIVKEEIYLSNKLIDIHLYQLVKDLVDLDELYDVVDYISGYCKSHEIIILDQMLFIIAWMILFSVTRVEQGYRLIKRVTLQHKNETIKSMLHTLLEDMQYSLEVEDMTLLQNYMETLGLFSKQSATLVCEDNEDILHEFREQMKIKYSLDFEDMPSLFENFKSHLEFAVKRLLMDYQLVNPLLQEVKTKYSFAYEISMLIVPIVFKKYGLYMQEDEISFLALYIQPFLKVQETSVRTLLVYGTTQSVTNFIETWIHQEFKERIHVIGYATVYQLEKSIRQQQVDLIITNVPLEMKVDIPLIQIMQLPMEADRIKIENFISRAAMASQSVNIFHKVFSKERILMIEEDISFEEILKRSARVLELQGKIISGDEFVMDILSRESVYPTHIEQGCFMPHPLMNSAKESAICLVLVKRNIKQDHRSVRCLFVSAFEPKIETDLKYIYNLINTIATTDSLLNVLMEMKSSEEVMNYLEKIIQITKR